MRTLNILPPGILPWTHQEFPRDLIQSQRQSFPVLWNWSALVSAAIRLLSGCPKRTHFPDILLRFLCELPNLKLQELLKAFQSSCIRQRHTNFSTELKKWPLNLEIFLLGVGSSMGWHWDEEYFCVVHIIKKSMHYFHKQRNNKHTFLFWKKEIGILTGCYFTHILSLKNLSLVSTL